MSNIVESNKHAPNVNECEQMPLKKKVNRCTVNIRIEGLRFMATSISS